MILRREIARRCVFAALAVTALASGPAVAASTEKAGRFGIEGNYGNEAGCRQLKSGDVDSDDLLMLTPESVATYATFCAFADARPGVGTSVIFIVQCGHEGEGYDTLGFMRIQKSDTADSYMIYDEAGTSWGEAKKCE